MAHLPIGTSGTAIPRADAAHASAHAYARGYTTRTACGSFDFASASVAASTASWCCMTATAQGRRIPSACRLAARARGPRQLATQCTALRHMRACSGQAGSRLRCRGAVRRHALRKACSRHYRERGSDSARAAGRAFVPQCPRQRRGPSHSPSQPMMRNRSVDESSTTHVSASAIKPDGLPPAATRERTRARLPARPWHRARAAGARMRSGAWLQGVLGSARRRSPVKSLCLNMRSPIARETPSEMSAGLYFGCPSRFFQMRPAHS